MCTPVVLVVDDEEDMRTVLREELESEGYTVEVAVNGGEALSRLQTALPALILLDLMMPVMDGVSLLRRLEEDARLASIHVIVMTAIGETPDTTRLRYPLLRKPFSPQTLLEAVTTECPRLWDAEEPPTREDDRLLGADSQMRKLPKEARDTQRQHCSVCGGGASARCRGCGEAFCRACLDAGPDGQCARCWRAKRALS